MARQKLFLFIILSFAFIHYGYGLDIQAAVDKRQMAMDEDITVTIQISGENIKKEPPYPAVNPSKDFKLINKNKYQSSSQNISIVNGKMRRTIVKTFTYQFTFKPLRTGELHLPALNIKAGNVQKPVAPTAIKVLKESPESADVDLILHFKKKTLYVNEQVLLTAVLRKKVNSNIRLRNIPDIEKELKKFFWVKSLTKKVTGSVKVVNGEQFEVYPVNFIVFPLASGRIKVPSIPLEYQVVVRSRGQGKRPGRDPFSDPFFSSFFESARTVTRTKYSRPVILNVKPVPDFNKPESFTGAVGAFQLKAELDKTTLKAGEALNLKAVISGKGNEKSVNDLFIRNMDKFEVFDPEITSKVNIRHNQVYISKTFKYVLIPQVEGNYTIGPISLYFFNPDQGRYDSAQTPLDINVKKGKAAKVSQGRYLSKEEIKLLGKDIRYIKTEAIKMKDESARLYKRTLFFWLALLPFFYSVAIVFIKRRTDRLKSDVGYARLIKARGTASRILSSVQKQMKDMSGIEFFSNVHKSVTGYIADKLNISAAGLTRAHIEAGLKKRRVDQALVKEAINFLEACDLYRFSTLESKEEERIGKLKQAENLITRLDKELK
jgi:hypothetical protein